MRWQGNADARPDIVVRVHQIVDHRGRKRFLVTINGERLCVSLNPISCAAEALLYEGYDRSMEVIFEDAELGIQETMTLSEAADFQMHGVGEVVPFRRRAQP